jgi:hypothetical protein
MSAKLDCILRICAGLVNLKGELIKDRTQEVVAELNGAVIAVGDGHDDDDDDVLVAEEEDSVDTATTPVELPEDSENSVDMATAPV